MSTSETIHNILRTHWGYETFRPGQEQAITTAIGGGDVFVLFPTGGGKSLCYQVPAIAQDGICIVISPLIALMQDQVEQLRARNVKADYLHSGMTYFEIDRILDNAIYGDTKLLYIAPERLKHTLTMERMKQMNIDLVAVDEAHCISQWGHDFRPAYREINELREIMPKVPFMALTATATPLVRDDIMSQLTLKEPTIVDKSFYRPNLHFIVRREEDKIEQVVHMLNHVEGAAIVYVRSRKKTMDMASLLMKKGVGAAGYHAGLSHHDRSEIMKRWMQDDIRVVCATNAFGMGVDKSDVRIVIHVELPPSLEEYYQEAGRAGRDGEKSYCVILFNEADEIRMDNKFKLAFPDDDTIKHIYACIGNHFSLATGSGEGESFDFDFQSFVEKYHLGYQVTSNTIRILEQSGWIAMASSYYQPSRVMMVADKLFMYDYQLKHKSAAIFIKMILRSYEGLYSQFVRISETFLAKQLNTSKKVIEQMLEQLQADEIIDYEPASESAKLTMLLPRSSADNFSIDKKLFALRKKMMRERLESVKRYITGAACRTRILLQYFGEDKTDDCGKCDICLDKNNRPDDDTYNKFKAIILKNIDGQATLKTLLGNFPSNRHQQVQYVLQRLQQEQWIQIKNDIVVLHPSKTAND